MISKSSKTNGFINVVGSPVYKTNDLLTFLVARSVKPLVFKPQQHNRYKNGYWGLQLLRLQKPFNRF